MTKQREPLTYEATLTFVTSVIGWDRCAHVCGVGVRAIRYWTDADCERHIRMIDAERLDRAFIDHGGDHAPFHRLFTLRLEIAAQLPTDADLAQQASLSAKETGEAVAALIDAAANAKCRKTRRRAKKEVQEAIEALTSGLASLERADNPGASE